MYKIEADFLHVAALAFAEHFAGAANFKVVHRQIEAASELLKILDGFEPLFCILRQAAGVGHHQVRIRLVVRATDPAAQLVQLRQPELVGAVNDDRVRGRYVNAGFDDRRA